MPQILKIGAYLVYFWANENDTLEPVHVHIALGVPSANATKIWVTKEGNVYCVTISRRFQNMFCAI